MNRELIDLKACDASGRVSRYDAITALVAHAYISKAHFTWVHSYVFDSDFMDAHHFPNNFSDTADVIEDFEAYIESDDNCSGAGRSDPQSILSLVEAEPPMATVGAVNSAIVDFIYFLERHAVDDYRCSFPDAQWGVYRDQGGRWVPVSRRKVADATFLFNARSILARTETPDFYNESECSIDELEDWFDLRFSWSRYPKGRHGS